MSAKTFFKLETIYQIGHLADDFDALLAASVHDCKQRPALAKPREVRITVRITPDKSDPADVVVHAGVGAKMPGREALPYLMQSTAQNGLRFAPSSPLEPDQGELFEE